MQALTRALVALAGLGAVATAALLARQPFLPGTDAYAYVVQARVLLERGQLQFDDGAIVVHALTALLSHALGLEGAVCALMGLAAWLPLASVARAAARLVRAGATTRGLFVIAYASLSPALFSAAVEVPRQAIAFALLPLWLEAWRAVPRRSHGGAAARAPESAAPAGARWSPRSLAWWLAPLASVLVHRMMLVPALLLLVAAIVRSLPPKARRAGLVVPALICVGGALLLTRVLLERGGGDFGLLERALLCVPMVLLTLASAPAPAPAGERPARWLVLIATLACVVIGVVARPFAHPHTRDARDLSAEARAIAVLTSPELQPPALVVARRQLAFLYTARTGRDAFLFEPEAHWDARRITRVVHGVSSSELAAHLPFEVDGRECTWARVPDSEYTLVSEDCYRAMRAKVLASNDEPGLAQVLTNDAQNPSRPRPTFLRERATRAPSRDDAFPP